MTIKLPEPVGRVKKIRWDGAQDVSVYKQPLSSEEEYDFYTEAQLKQAIRDALEKLRENTTHKVLEDWEKWAYSAPLDEREQNLCDALKDIRASVDVTEAALKKVLVAVQEYLPPNGITKDELISRVIACVDPWPSDEIRKRKEQLK